VSSAAPLLLDNVGAEEGDATRSWPVAAVDAARAVAALWRSLFEAPPFDWLPGPDQAAAWLNTPEAERAASDAKRPLYGAPAEVVRRVHDKAFALEVARGARLVPDALEGCSAVLEPSELLPAEAGVRALEARAAAFPAWARERLTLKPRLGSSGRGRVACKAGEIDAPAVRGALPRLAARGGLVLEPWLRRHLDLSANLWVSAGAEVRLLGTARQLLTRAGVYRGQAGLVDSRGRVSSGSDDDEALREAAATAALAAADVGYWGPLGIDAFRFEGPGGELALRPLVEINARFTVGAVVLGLLRRHLPEIRSHLGIGPGERATFHFGLDAPTGGWPSTAAERLHLDLPVPGSSLRPGLLVTRGGEALEMGAPGVES